MKANFAPAFDETRVPVSHHPRMEQGDHGALAEHQARIMAAEQERVAWQATMQVRPPIDINHAIFVFTSTFRPDNEIHLHRNALRNMPKRVRVCTKGSVSGGRTRKRSIPRGMKRISQTHSPSTRQVWQLRCFSSSERCPSNSSIYLSCIE